MTMMNPTDEFLRHAPIASRRPSSRAIRQARRHGAGWPSDGFNALDDAGAKAWRHTTVCRQSDTEIMPLVGLITKFASSPGLDRGLISCIVASTNKTEYYLG
jgi:hypothetical protein